MQELENILKEIDTHAIEFELFGTSDDYISVGWVKDIIRKNMNDDKCGECSRRKWYLKGCEDGKKNNGWILSEEKPPEKKSVLMCDAAGCREIGWWDGKRWKTGFSHADNFDTIAWQPLPKPYRT